MKVSDDELALNQIPLYARDHCAHWLIELKRCHRKEFYLPWKCEFEKHNYEACVLQEYGKESDGHLYSVCLSGIRREKIKRREELLRTEIKR